MMKFLFQNPLETFKSFAFDFNITQISNSTNQVLIDKSFFHHDSFMNNDFFFSTTGSSLLFNISTLVALLLVYFYFTQVKNINHFFLTIIFVIVSQIIFYIFSIQTFVQTNVLFDFNFENLVETQVIGSTSGIISLFFLKESISFITLFLVWWLLANYSFSETLLIPRTIIEVADEVIYKASLNMFADVLHLKHNHEVQNFQELFIKVHGLLLFVLVANVQGMVPYTATITSSLVNTFFLASAVFINILIIMIKEKGITHFLSLFLPSGCPFPLMFLLVPIEFISYVFRVVSLSVRLFANMMAGHTLLKVIVGFSWSMILIGDLMILAHYVPFLILFILTFLEIAVGFIQSYIFIILTYMYLNDIFAGH